MRILAKTFIYPSASLPQLDQANISLSFFFFFFFPFLFKTRKPEKRWNTSLFFPPPKFSTKTFFFLLFFRGFRPRQTNFPRIDILWHETRSLFLLPNLPIQSQRNKMWRNYVWRKWYTFLCCWWRKYSHLFFLPVLKCRPQNCVPFNVLPELHLICYRLCLKFLAA